MLHWVYKVTILKKIIILYLIMENLLLKTKLTIPPLKQDIIKRSQLLEMLNNGLSQKLILVSAPAGYGKTTLLLQWIHSLDYRNSAWLSLDAYDNDPVRFYSYLLAALKGAGISINEDIHKIR